MAEESKQFTKEERTVVEQAEKQVADKFKINGKSKANQILSLSPEGLGGSNVRRKFLNQLAAKTPLQEHEIYYLGVIEPSIFDLLKRPGKRTIKNENGEEHDIKEDTDLLELLGGPASFLKDVKDSLFGKTINSTEIRVAVHKKTGDTTFYSKPNDNALDRMVAIAEKMYEGNGNNRFVISCDNDKTCKKFAEKLQAAGLVPVIDHKNPALAMNLYKDIKAKGPASLSSKILYNLESLRDNPDISSFLNKYYEDNPHEIGRQLQQGKGDKKPKMKQALPSSHENIHSAPIPPVVNEQSTLTASISHREAVSAIGGTVVPANNKDGFDLGFDEDAFRALSEEERNSKIIEAAGYCNELQAKIEEIESLPKKEKKTEDKRNQRKALEEKYTRVNSDIKEMSAIARELGQNNNPAPPKGPSPTS